MERERERKSAPACTRMIPEDIFPLSFFFFSSFHAPRDLHRRRTAAARLSISDAPRNNARNVASPWPCVADPVRGRGRTNPIGRTCGDPISRGSPLSGGIPRRIRLAEHSRARYGRSLLPAVFIDCDASERRFAELRSPTVELLAVAAFSGRCRRLGASRRVA